ncbi:MAG: TolB family protein, partial [Terriglobia bacterium]
LEPQPLPGTDEAQFPFWSPDSRWIAFFAEGKLKKIAAAGGPSQTLCDAAAGTGGTWNRAGAIVFSPVLRSPLQRVSAAGGQPSPLPGSADFRTPAFLPDGARYLYLSSAGADGLAGVHIASFDGKPGRRVLADQSLALYAAPRAGERDAHLLFVREGTLMAQPVDPGTLQSRGELFPVAERISAGLFAGSWAVSISENGILVYQTGGGSREQQLVWYDRTGKELEKVGAPHRFFGLALSPDEKTVALARGEATGADLWLYDLARRVETRLTFEPKFRHAEPLFSPDGKRLAFNATPKGAANLYLKATGAGKDEPLLESGPSKFVTDWSRDGRFLLYSQLEPKTRQDIFVLPLEGDRKPFPFLQTGFHESQAQFSPDGKYVAYASDESGRYEIYVRPFPSGAGKLRISNAGGQWPRWRRDGGELFYLSPDRKLMAVAMKTSSSGIQPGAPQLLFGADFFSAVTGFNLFSYAVAENGKRFLARVSAGDTAPAPLTVLDNWK